MRARMITALAGPEGTALAGQVVDGPDERVQALIDGGFAEPLEKGVEVATSCALREVAVSPDAKRGGKRGAAPA